MHAQGDRKIETLKRQIVDAREKREAAEQRLKTAKELTMAFTGMFEQAQRQICEKRLAKQIREGSAQSEVDKDNDSVLPKQTSSQPNKEQRRITVGSDPCCQGFLFFLCLNSLLMHPCSSTIHHSRLGLIF